MLDRESMALLHSISKHSGYAYVSMAKAVRKMVWEQLHSRSFRAAYVARVLLMWRDAYSMACLYVARLHYASGDFREVLRVLDLGIVMGGMLLHEDLDFTVEKVTE
ncbi:hypothetical protein Fmac_010938 [Flemingia macrophylla]|uniref:DM8 domain-containing protein n=1 Tax=Flemingia macrophylla TaxID=520843 RepID=A0ABD1MKZ8_9FABA